MTSLECARRRRRFVVLASTKRRRRLSERMEEFFVERTAGSGAPGKPRARDVGGGNDSTTRSSRTREGEASRIRVAASECRVVRSFVRRRRRRRRRECATRGITFGWVSALAVASAAAAAAAAARGFSSWESIQPFDSSRAAAVGALFVTRKKATEPCVLRDVHIVEGGSVEKREERVYFLFLFPQPEERTTRAMRI